MMAALYERRATGKSTPRSATAHRGPAGPRGITMRFPELHYHWSWRLRATPAALWPLVADTNRFNRDTGLPAVQSGDSDGGPPTGRQLRFSRFGMSVAWDEAPFEWLRPYRFGVVRHYRAGPITTMRVQVELRPV